MPSVRVNPLRNEKGLTPTALPQGQPHPPEAGTAQVVLPLGLLAGRHLVVAAAQDQPRTPDTPQLPNMRLRR